MGTSNYIYGCVGFACGNLDALCFRGKPNSQWFVGLAHWNKWLYVCKRRQRRSKLLPQQVQVCTVVLEQAVSVIQIQDQTVVQFVINVQDNGTLLHMAET